MIEETFVLKLIYNSDSNNYLSNLYLTKDSNISYDIIHAQIRRI